MHAGRRFRLGLLALLSGGAFFGLLGFVLQGVLGNDHVSYFILFEENVKGMVIGSKCNFQGVPIGMVKDIRFQNGKTMVELSVDPTKADIQDLTRARLDRLLVTGQVTVELEGYGQEGKALRPGQFVQPKADPINQLTRTLPELVPQVAEILARLDQLLDAENRAHIAAILRNGDTAMAAMPPLLAQGGGLMTRAEAALTALDRAAATINGDLLPASAQTLADARAAVADLRKVGSQMGAAAQAADALLAGLRGPTQSALASLRTSLDELRGFARQLRLAPDSLLFGVSRPAGPAGGER